MRICSLFAVCLGIGFGNPLFAGEIVSARAEGPGLGTRDGTIELTKKWPSPNNDNDDSKGGNFPWGQGNNFRRYGDDFQFDVLGYIDVVLTVDPTGDPNLLPATEHEVAAKIVNNTGVPWTGIRLVLGTGVGQAFSPLAPGTLDGLDFDDPDWDPRPPEAKNHFDRVNHAPTVLEFGNDVLGDQQNELLQFYLDVPDNEANDNYDFTLRHIPLPEPASAGMMMVFASLLGRRRAG